MEFIVKFVNEHETCSIAKLVTEKVTNSVLGENTERKTYFVLQSILNPMFAKALKDEKPIELNMSELKVIEREFSPDDEPEKVITLKYLVPK